MFGNKNCTVSDKNEKHIIDLIDTYPPKCFEKMTDKEIQGIQKIVNVDENVIKRIRDIVIRNKIFENSKKYDREEIVKEFDKKKIDEISKEYYIPPETVVSMYVQHNQTENFTKDEISDLYRNNSDAYSKIDKLKIKAKIYSYNTLILTLLKNMGVKCFPYEKNEYNNIFIMDSKCIINGETVNWLICVNDYGSNIQKLYDDFDYKTIIDKLDDKYGNGGMVFNYGYNEKLKTKYKCFLYCYNENNNNYENPTTNRDGDFYKMGLKTKTDKITHHYYYSIYPVFLEQFRTLKNSALLEIGIDKSRSLNLFKEYFPYAFIYGIDINIEEEDKESKIFKVDQSNVKQLEKVKDYIFKNDKKIFLIIDDGSHVPEHQLITFNYYFVNLLIFGGIYIIEDIETSYWSNTTLYGYKVNAGYKNSKSLIETFKHTIDAINYEFLTDEDRSELNKICKIPFEVRDLIHSITFSQNCIVIQKKSLDQIDIGKRPYRFARYIKEYDIKVR